MVSIVLWSMDSLSQAAGFIAGCVGTRRCSPDEIQMDMNIPPVGKAVDNLVDKVWSLCANTVGRCLRAGLSQAGRYLPESGKPD